MGELKKIYRTGILIASLVIILPFLSFLHLLFSESSTSIIIFSFELKHNMIHNQAWAWCVLNFIIPMLLLVLAFFTIHSPYKFFFIPLISFYLISIGTTLDLFTSIFTSPLTLDKLLVIIILTGILLWLDKRSQSKIQNISINRFISASLFFKIDLGLKNTIQKVLQLRKEKIQGSVYSQLRKMIHLKNVLKDNYDILLDDRSETIIKHLQRLEISAYVLIVIIYLMWFLPFLVNDGVEAVEIMGLEISSFGFRDVSLFLWFVSRKLVIILFLSLWFITCPFWWRYAILSPLAIYSYQFYEAFQDIEILDAGSNLRVLPLVLLNVTLVIAISKMVKYRAKFIALYEGIAEEVEELLNELKSEYPREVARTLDEIRKEGRKGREAEVRRRLMALEKEIAARLDLGEG